MQNISIRNLDNIYQAGLHQFAENLLREKMAQQQGLLFFIDGKDVHLTKDDVNKLYAIVSTPLQPSQYEELAEKARQGSSVRFVLQDTILEIPANVLIGFYGIAS